MSSAVFMAAEEAPESVDLQPGQLYAASHAALISTILGSCVAVCLYDPRARVGGMNHFVLPQGSGLRYGNVAMQELLDAMTDRGALVARMVAKVFGGAFVTNDATAARNAETARRFLATHSIAVRADQTGGARGRKLLFHTGTGQAFVREI